MNWTRNYWWTGNVPNAPLELVSIDCDLRVDVLSAVGGVLPRGHSQAAYCHCLLSKRVLGRGVHVNGDRQLAPTETLLKRWNHKLKKKRADTKDGVSTLILADPDTKNHNNLFTLKL